MTCFIKFLQIYFLFSKIYCIHSASNIHAYNIWNCFTLYCHGSSNCTAFTCMYIRHNPNAASFCKILITHSANLFNCFLLNYVCIANSCGFCTFYFQHCFISSFPAMYNSLSSKRKNRLSHKISGQ